MASPRSIALKVFVLAALPFVLSAGYMSYRSLWFKLAGAQTIGTVVSIAEEGTPSLVVEYHTESGQVLRTKSAGSDFYQGIALEHPIAVYYDPRDPSDARLDLFVENWVLPLFTGFPGLVCLLACLIILRKDGGL